MTVLTIENVRIFDPASGYDEMGNIVCEDGVITGFGPHIDVNGDVLDGEGLICAPGLIDMRVRTGEPGNENSETLATAAQAAIAGGVTSIVIMPETNPVIDDMSLVDFLKRRGDELPVNVHIAGALTKGLDGHSITEIGLMSEAGAVMFSNGATPIANAQIMRRILAYGSRFNALIANRCVSPELSAGTVAHESDLSARLGLLGAPAISERIMAERDIALAELTGGQVLIDLVSSEDVLRVIRRAKSRDLDVAASVSINHLALNELDIGDYRSFAKLDPPLREERDRQALIAAVNDGTIDVIVSDHNPQPAGQKRLPYSEAASGAVGLEILLTAGLSQVADGGLDLRAMLTAMTARPAELLGLKAGRITEGAPADLVLFDDGLPWVCDSDQLRSGSKNTPFDGRRLTGRTVHTIKDGRVVYSA
ncbi:dihydroorotase [Litorimonas sp. RW-G-Af-16]|uniref:dihydroorotase n=1 Tax=Litorimonas sp. RW-G-Af-16 TaxID=3241168 RepID=UPI00390C6B08